jgi:hypothetical protein
MNVFAAIGNTRGQSMLFIFRCVAVAALAATCSCSKSDQSTSDTVEAVIGKSRFDIPVNYISPTRINKNASVERESFGVNFFLPSFDGFGDGKSTSLSNPERVACTIFANGKSGRPEVLNGLSRLISTGVIIRSASDDRYHLAAYSLTGDKSKIYIGTGSHGNSIGFMCSTDAINNMCQVDYHHAGRAYDVICEYNAVHLAEWKVIDDELNRKLELWRRN